MLIKVRVKTVAKNERIEKVSEDHFNISVREEPENNLANGRVVTLIATHFRLPVADVRIVKGHHRPSKILSVGKQE